MGESLHVAVLEPYYGGSHAAFVNTIRDHSRHRITLATMPARKWKWRMRGAALWFTGEGGDWMRSSDGPPDAILCNDMLSVSDLRALLPDSLRSVPIACYFHENQLTYPLSPHDERDYQYGMTNIVSCMSADVVWFNSAHHRKAFLAEADAMIRQMPDFVPANLTPIIMAKSAVLFPPVHAGPTDLPELPRIGPTRILWPHRWEYDKNPKPFFDALVRLHCERLDFQLVLLGERFRDAPAAFADARRQLGDRVIDTGYLPNRSGYLDTVRSCDLVVSTAIQENFGLAVVEAVISGCQPLVPRRLAYPEVIPRRWHEGCLYESDADLLTHLRRLILGEGRLSDSERCELRHALVQRYGVKASIGALDAALEALVRQNRVTGPKIDAAANVS